MPSRLGGRPAGVVPEGSEDRMIERNTRRIEMMQRMIDRFTKRKDELVAQNDQVLAVKAQRAEARLVLEKEGKTPQNI